ncbi:MAG: hypothetical protein COA78_35715 [Blastopirellula sp.]|nr:MAG: hypothetical protein COA78_35715 [Blastopirellula sp.]
MSSNVNSHGIGRALSIFVRDAGMWRTTFVVSLAMLSMVLEFFSISFIYPIVIFVVSGKDGIQAILERLPPEFSFVSYLLPDTLEGFLALLLSIFLLRQLVLVAIHFVQAKINAWAQVSISKSLFNGYQKMPYQDFVEESEADLLRNMTFLVHGAYTNGFTATIQLLADGIVAFGLVLVALIYASWPLYLTGMAIGGLIFCQQILFGRIFRKLGNDSKELCSEEIEVVSNMMASFKEMRVLNKASMFFSKFVHIQDRMKSNVSVFEFARRLPPVLIETIVFIGFAIVALITFSVNETKAEALGAIAVFGLIGFRGIPITNRIVHAINSLENCLPSLTILDEQRKLAQIWATDCQDKRIRSTDAKGDDFSVKFAGVCYTYPGSGRGVDNVTFSLPPKGLVCCVGQSGSGKSTIINLLIGLLEPNSGTIVIDDKYIGRIGYVPQSFFLLNRSIGHNIAFSYDDDLINYDRVAEALKLAGLHEFANIEQMTSTIGDNGVLLSGGQRQRMALARALYGDPDCLILDEPTSGLDTQTENQIFDTLSTLAENKLVIIITHQEKLATRASQIIQVVQGKAKLSDSFIEELPEQESFDKKI